MRCPCPPAESLSLSASVSSSRLRANPLFSLDLSSSCGDRNCALSAIMCSVELAAQELMARSLAPLDPDPVSREESWHCSGCIAYKRHRATRNTWSSSSRKRDRSRGRGRGRARELSDRERGHLRRDEVRQLLGRRHGGRGQGRTLRALRVVELDDLDLVAPLDALRAARRSRSA